MLVGTPTVLAAVILVGTPAIWRYMFRYYDPGQRVWGVRALLIATGAATVVATATAGVSLFTGGKVGAGFGIVASIALLIVVSLFFVPLWRQWKRNRSR